MKTAILRMLIATHLTKNHPSTVTTSGSTKAATICNRHGNSA
jgi:hypothetical protein